MPLLKGALTAARFRVEGAVPDGFRDVYIEALNNHAFQEPLSPLHMEEVTGWVQVHNLLDTQFDDLNRWLYNNYVVLAFRTDKKSLPTRYFQAHLQKRIEQWCLEHARERAPSAVKKEIRELLQQELLRQCLPTVATLDMVWDIHEGWALVEGSGGAAHDNVRKLFFRTFGLVLTPADPADYLPDVDVLTSLLACGPTDLRGTSA